MVGGIAAALGGGALYAVSMQSRSQFEATNDADEALRLMQQTNRLSVASGLTVALGVGTIGAGVAVSANGLGPVFSGRF